MPRKPAEPGFNGWHVGDWVSPAFFQLQQATGENQLPPKKPAKSVIYICLRHGPPGD